jgi:hypothetical protein
MEMMCVNIVEIYILGCGCEGCEDARECAVFDGRRYSRELARRKV